MDERLASQLRALFVAELEEHVAALNRDLLDIERGASPQEQADRIASILRTTHTLKGASRAADVPILEQASHHLEDVLVAMRAGRPVDAELFGLLFATTDAFAGVGERLAAGRPAGDAALTRIIADLVAASRAPEVPAPAIPSPTEELAAAAAAPALRILAAKVDDLLSQSADLLMAIRRQAWQGGGQAGGAQALSDARAVLAAAAALDDGIKRLRMTPFREGVAHLKRAVRDVAASTGKDIGFQIGADLEMDRAVLDALRDPLLHLVRNAVSHGIEAPEARRAGGKPARGTIDVSAVHDRAGVRVTVSDDGRGLDFGALRAQLARRGLPVPSDDASLARSVFLPGLSTAAMVTDVSGRGVGLDVVRRVVEGLRGTIDVASTGAGTTFVLRVPLTLSTLRVLEVAAGGERFVLPVSSVKVLMRVAPADVHTVHGADAILLEGRPVPLTTLASVLGRQAQPRLGTGKLAVVVLSHGTDVALVVDELVDELDIVVKGLGPRLRGSRVVSGATALPSGRLALILDVPEVMARAKRGTARLVVAQVAARKRRLLLCDDSITTRTLEKSILEGAGYLVFAAVDGADGWRLLQETPDIDAVVSDVEMPNMDGFTLTETIRASPRFQHLPVILVTGLAAPDAHARGLAAGASAYIAKAAFDQKLLLDTLEDFV